jgi:hypothetical protein
MLNACDENRSMADDEVKSQRSTVDLLCFCVRIHP